MVNVEEAAFTTKKQKQKNNHMTYSNFEKNQAK